MVRGVNTKWHVDITNYSGGETSECSYTITCIYKHMGPKKIVLGEVTPISRDTLVKLTTRL